MPVWSIVLLIVIAVLIAALVALTIVGKKLQKKQEANNAQLEAAKQVMSMLVIDKKMMKMKDAGLPKMVLDQTPKAFRGRKMPIVKAKIGPRVMSLMCDPKVFDQIPIKAEVKAEVSGIYIVGIKSVRGGKIVVPEKKKKGFLRRISKDERLHQRIAGVVFLCRGEGCGWGVCRFQTRSRSLKCVADTKRTSSLREVRLLSTDAF